MSEADPISEIPSPITPTGPVLVEAPPPVPVKIEPPTPLAIRMWCLFALCITGSILAVGLWLHPSPLGVGTHQQMHMPPCGMLLVTGVPCPTCGCTTAVSYFAHGQILQSFYTQPFGAVVGLLCFVITVLSIVGIISGRWIGPSMFWLNWYWRSIFAVSVVILLVGWIYKIFMIRLGY